jgi:hypothetical protein
MFDKVDILNMSDEDLRVKETVLSVLAKLSLSDANADLVFSSLSRISSGYEYYCVLCVVRMLVPAI